MVINIQDCIVHEHKLVFDCIKDTMEIVSMNYVCVYVTANPVIAADWVLEGVRMVTKMLEC